MRFRRRRRVVRRSFRRGRRRFGKSRGRRRLLVIGQRF